MEMVFMVLWVNAGIVVLPEKYPASQCKELQDKSSKGYVLCIDAPNLSIMKDKIKDKP